MTRPVQRRDKAVIERDRADILRLARPDLRAHDLARMLGRPQYDVAADINALRKSGKTVPTETTPPCMVNGGALYRQFDAEGRLLYVGATSNPYARSVCHASASHWFRRVVRIEMEWFDNGADLLRAEREAIANERPLINRQHNPERPRPRRPAPSDARAAS